MNLTSFTPGAFGAQSGLDALRTLRATGTNDVTIVFSWYVDDAADSTVAPDPAKTPTDAAILTALENARALGFKTTLKPLVDTVDGSFRGDLAPSDRAAFFASYGKLVDATARLASQGAADTLVIGTELKSLSHDTEQWHKLVVRARSTFGGRMTYGANWVDEAESVGFWGDLDEIGIDAYMPLSNQARPTTQALVDAWKPYVDRIEKLHKRFDRPVSFTELGYPSRQYAAQRPGVEGDGAVDQAVQANAYEAAFLAWRDVPWFRGIHWWEWSADGDNVNVGDGSYRPAGKQAEQVLRRFYEAGGAGGATTG